MIVLEPRRLDERIIKIQQRNKRLLMENEILNIEDFNIFCLYINNRWDFELDPKLIKCKKIVGDIELYLNHIPSWMKHIEIDGYFYCSSCVLTSLKNCPKIINGTFFCEKNNLTSLDDGPTFVGNYWIDNNVKFTEEYVRSICKVKGNIFII